MFGIKLSTPFVVAADECATGRLAVHTVYLFSVVGHDGDGKEVQLQYDWLGGPTEEECDRYRQDRADAVARGEGLKLYEREKEALAHMHEQYLLRR